MPPWDSARLIRCILQLIFLFPTTAWLAKYYRNLNYLVAFITFAIVSWQMFAYTGRLYISAQVTSVLGVSIYPFVLISALGVVLFTLVLLWDLVKAIYKLFSRGVEDEYSTHWNS